MPKENEEDRAYEQKNTALSEKSDNPSELELISPGQIRVRIAPSPTGPMHIGLARVALFNYLFAKKNNGNLILRIEDTDRERSEERWEKEIIQGLSWLQIEWQEGPLRQNGKYGPYYQSKRKEIYKKYIKKLLDEEKIYYCFCSKQDLDAQRQYLMSIGKPPIYSGKCRYLSKKEVEENLSKGKPYVLRLKTQPEKIVFYDKIRGKIEYNTETFGDIVVAKDISTPLYNLACVIDDYEMRISHIIRGEDHIPNTPKQILIARALGIKTPAYLHLPLILGPDKSKLSKRHGAKSVLEYKKEGYLPEAMINFLALLGWNPGTEKEIFSITSLIKEFSVERIQKSGAVFNPRKLDWINGFYIRKKPIEKLTSLCIPYLIKEKLIAIENNKNNRGKIALEQKKYKILETDKIVSFNYIKEAVLLYQERLRKISEISQLIDFFFKKELNYEKDLLRWKDMTDKEIKTILDRLKKILSSIKENQWTEENIKAVLNKSFYEQKFKLKKEAGKGDRGYFLWPLRVALSGKKNSAGPFEISALLGKKETLERIDQAKKKI